MTNPNDNGQEPIETAQNPTSDPSLQAGRGEGTGGGAGPVPAWVSDPAAAYAEIQKLRDEAGRHRTHANQLEAELSAAAAEVEQRGQALEALRAARREGEIRSAVLLEAARAGIADPSDALALADLSGVSLDEAGHVTGAQEAVAALITAKPYLASGEFNVVSPRPFRGEGQGVREPAPAISPTNPGGGPALRPDDLRALSSEAIARMDPDELRAALKG